MDRRNFLISAAVAACFPKAALSFPQIPAGLPDGNWQFNFNVVSSNPALSLAMGRHTENFTTRTAVEKGWLKKTDGGWVLRYPVTCSNNRDEVVTLLFPVRLSAPPHRR